MKVLIDTNVILDVLCKRPKFYEDSAKVFKLCEVKKIEDFQTIYLYSFYTVAANF